SLGNAALGHGFVYSPLAALAFVPLGIAGPAGWIGFCGLVFLAGLIVAVRRAPAAVIAIAPWVIVWQGGLANGVYTGQLNVLIAGMVPFVRFGGATWASWLLGATKVWPGLLLVVAVRRRRWVAILRGLAVLLVMVAVSLL